MNYSEQLVPFIKAWEGLKLTASGDALVAGVTDIGYGHVLLANDPRTITEAEADKMLRADLALRCERVEAILGSVDMEQNQLDAVLSIVYNMGVSAMAGSTMFRYLRCGMRGLAADEFPKWNHAAGKVAVGLTKRRAAERAMFLNGDYSGRP